MAGTATNVILIVIDDLGWRDLGCTGSDFHETPNIDALAARGTLFTRAYAGAPNCSPSRAAIMSGKSPARVGITMQLSGHQVGRLCDVPGHKQLPTQEYSLARAFRREGRQTWHVGKWHLGPRSSWPERHGFDVNIGGCEAGAPSTYFSPYDIPTLPDGPDGEYLTDRITDEAIKLIMDHGDRPFFLNLWHYAVHTPLQAPADLIAKYEAKARDQGRGDADVEPGAEWPYWWAKGPGRHNRRRRQGNPTYAAMMENLDDNIGRLVAALDSAGLLDSTAIIFTSDNGGVNSTQNPPTCNAPLADGKGWLREGGLRVPLIIAGPGVAAGQTSDVPAISSDLYPTSLALAGCELLPEQHTDGIDLFDADATAPGTERPLHWHFPHYPQVGGLPASAMRRGKWKLIRCYEDDTDKLYDLDADEGETTDVAAEHPDVLTDLAAELDRWLADVDARLPKPNPYQPFDEYAHDGADPGPRLVSRAQPN